MKDKERIKVEDRVRMKKEEKKEETEIEIPSSKSHIKDERK